MMMQFIYQLPSSTPISRGHAGGCPQGRPCARGHAPGYCVPAQRSDERWRVQEYLLRSGIDRAG